MSGILSAIGSKLWRTPQVEKPVPAPQKQPVEVKTDPYFRNEKGWPCYNIEMLSIEQCDVVNTECRTEASFERNWAIAEAVGATLLGLGMIGTGVLVAKLASLFFVTFFAAIAIHSATTFSSLTYFLIRVVTHLAVISGTATLIQMLWNATYESVQNHWEAAKHLDDQGVRALLHKTKENYVKKVELAPAQ
ncbi:MAG: hypothetical protein JSS30_04940 [Verrucomicrobia bacterium]|nr:hypothetical protein [Verrucomicrobiota bacterium]